MRQAKARSRTGPHGETERRFEPIRTHTAFCITEDAGRRIMAEQVRIMADEKVDFFQFLDQNIGGGAFPCYRADHHHPSVPGREGTDAMRGTRVSVALGHIVRYEEAKE